MKVLWLGQGGLLFVSGKTKIMIDPYLTNSLSLLDYNLDRQMKINKKLFSVKPSVLVLTNCHPDHADPKTIERFAKKLKKKLVILSCESVFGDIVCEKHIEGCNNILFEAGSEWTVDNVTISAVSAKTDDRSAFGVIITDNETGRKYYVAGDTLYNRQVLAELPDDIYAAFIPINGEYGSMNILDAKRFAKAVDPRFVVPIHFGMFDKVDPMKLKLLNMIVPKIYRIIDFEKWDSSAPYKKSLDRGFNERPEVEMVTEFEIPTDEPMVNPYLYEEDSLTTEATKDSELDVEPNTEVEVASLAEEGDSLDNQTVFYEDIDEVLDKDDATDEDPSVVNAEEDEIINQSEDDESIDTPSEDEEVLDEDEEVLDEDEEVLDEDEEILDEDEEILDEDEEILDEDEEILDEDEEILDEDEEILDEDEEILDEEVPSEDEEADDSSSSYTPRPTGEEDDADKIDAFIRELERYERGEDPEDK